MYDFFSLQTLVDDHDVHDIMTVEEEKHEDVAWLRAGQQPAALHDADELDTEFSLQQSIADHAMFFLQSLIQQGHPREGMLWSYRFEKDVHRWENEWENECD